MRPELLSPDALKALVRTVPDFPEPGILFRDITTLIGDSEGLASSVHHLADIARAKGAQKIAGMEARGFIFGAAVAVQLGIGFLPVRKPGKLPRATLRQDYRLEYGSDAVEMHSDAVQPGDRVLIVDDVLATGGTMAAACELVVRAGGELAGCAVLIEIAKLDGAERVPVAIHAVLET